MCLFFMLLGLSRVACHDSSVKRAMVVDKLVVLPIEPLVFDDAAHVREHLGTLERGKNGGGRWRNGEAFAGGVQFNPASGEIQPDERTVQ